jgi:ATP-dependent DNA helicase PIF1
MFSLRGRGRKALSAFGQTTTTQPSSRRRLISKKKRKKTQRILDDEEDDTTFVSKVKSKTETITTTVLGEHDDDDDYMDLVLLAPKNAKKRKKKLTLEEKVQDASGLFTDRHVEEMDKTRRKRIKSDIRLRKDHEHVQAYKKQQECIRQKTRGHNEDLRVSADKGKIIKYILSNPSARIIVQGWAGTGKSVLLNELVKVLGNDTVCLTATTGISALHIKGQTVHSALSLPFEVEGLTAQDYLSEKPGWLVKWLTTKFQAIQTLIIDEMSMLSAAALEFIDSMFRYLCRSVRPFAGRRVILSGDFLQLPPIKAKFLFQAETFGDMDFTCFKLTRNHRQKGDPEYAERLKRVATGRHSAADLEFFKSKIKTLSEIELMASDPTRAKRPRPTFIFTRKDDVKSHNEKMLRSLEAETKRDRLVFEVSTSFKMEGVSIAKTTKFKDKAAKVLAEKCKDGYLSSDVELLPGAQVMHCVNKESLVNGTRGIVTEASARCVKVLWENETVPLVLLPHTEEWRVPGFPKARVCTHHYSIMLAWALTVHKTQGLTLEEIVFNVSNMFADGHLYVGASRTRSGDGLYLTGTLDPKQITANSEAVHFIDEIKNVL